MTCGPLAIFEQTIQLHSCRPIGYVRPIENEILFVINEAIQAIRIDNLMFAI